MASQVLTLLLEYFVRMIILSYKNMLSEKTPCTEKTYDLEVIFPYNN